MKYLTLVRRRPQSAVVWWYIDDFNCNDEQSCYEGIIEIRVVLARMHSNKQVPIFFSLSLSK